MIGQLEPGRSLRECLYYLVSSILEIPTFDFCLFHSAGMMGRDSVSCDQQLEDQQWVVESRRFQRTIDVISCSNSISSLSFCLEFCLKHQNIIFKAQTKKSYGRYADLSILLTNGRELWQICGFMICSKLRAWRGMRICQYCSKCEGVKAILWIYDMFKTESLTRFADLSILFKM